MNINDILQLIIFFLVLILFSPLLGKYMFLVFSKKKHFMIPVFGKTEEFIYRMLKINLDREMSLKEYLISIIIFNLLGFILLASILSLQKYLPLNTQSYDNISLTLAFNIAVSFVTNTNFQTYAGETTLSYFSQMTGLTVQNFLSAATGIAVFLVITRAIKLKNSTFLGNFWSDITKSILYILLPLSVLYAIILLSQGVIQNFSGYTNAVTLEGKEQIIPSGPVASQIAIKQLGTNGGGFFNTNSAHPFENPTPLSNFLSMIAILLIPASLTFTFGYMLDSKKQGTVLFAAMLILFSAGLFASIYSEYQHYDYVQSEYNMEGKETRFGIMNSIIWSTATTAASNGSVNAMHSSLTPLSGMVAMLNIMLGEIIFGGIGSGMYGMLIFVFITVFLSGLMVGRTPEYLGKKIESLEIKMSILAILLPAAVILLFTAGSICNNNALKSISVSGPHGFSEILYAFSSAAGNNGSAFAGLNSNTDFLNIMTAIAMIIGRYGVIIPVMIIAGSFARKNIIPESAGTFKTDNIIFVILLCLVILIIGGLTFFPVLSLGPIVEHIRLMKGYGF